MINSLPRVAFWLVPEKNERARLCSLIESLAERYATVAFVPHVTIYSCYRSPQQNELATAERLARSFREITLKVDALTGGDKLTQALFLSFKDNGDLWDINRHLQANIFNFSDYKMSPHLSLLYQSLNADERNVLIREINPRMDTVHFNELRAVAIPEQLKSIDDLKGWQTLLSCRLASRENAGTL